MPMYLDQLRRLHQDMREQDMDRCKFPFARNQAEFQVVFFADQPPYALLFGLVGGQWSFAVDLLPRYRVETRLDWQTYSGLVRALGLEPDPDRPFRPADFFADLNGAIPGQIGHANRPQPQDVAPYRRDVDEAARIYFMEWRVHVDGRHVTSSNLKKTRTLLGNTPYILCRRRNVSSAWTDDPNKAKDNWMADLRRLLD